MEIKKWGEISHNYSDTILLGNGASIAVSEKFDYKSLYKAYCESKELDEHVQQIFKEYKTEDFEKILGILLHAILINKIFDIKYTVIEDCYHSVKNALIETIRKIHVPYEEVSCHLEKMGHFLRQFNTVVSLNYDLIIYWTIIYFLKNFPQYRFKDCFNNAKFVHKWSEYYRCLKGEETVTLVFYVHGNIILTSDDGNKICCKSDDKENKNLLNTIFDYWQNKRSLPLFVSEGDSKNKKLAINSNAYLSTVYNEVLPAEKKSLVIYGWGMGDQDDHILHQLRKAGIKRVAVSVHKGNEDFCNWAKKTIEKNLKRENEKEIEIEFFDAQSDDCWIYPINEGEQGST